MAGWLATLGLWTDQVPVVDPAASLVTPRWSPVRAVVAVDRRLFDSPLWPARDAGRFAAWARSLPAPPGGAPLTVAVADDLPALAGACAARRIAAVHPLVLSPEMCCDLDGPARRAVADAFVRTALDGLAGQFSGVVPSADDMLATLLAHGGASASAVESFLAAAPLDERPDGQRVASAEVDRLLAALNGSGGVRRARRAFELLRSSGDLTLLPGLQQAYRNATSDDARRRVVLVHRALAEKSYRVAGCTGQAVIRRRTYEGRLAEVDEHVVDLLTAARSGAGGLYRGVDLDRWSGAVAAPGPVVLVDHAVADGTTALDLACRLAAAFPGPVPAATVVGTDVAMELFLVHLGAITGVFGYDGALLQVRAGRRCVHRSGWAEAPALLVDERTALTARFRSMPDHERRAARLRWINPAAAAIEAEDPCRLRFESHDLREPYGRPVHIARAFGVLYSGLRTDSDSPAYFSAEGVETGLAAIGRAVVEGGLVIAGNVVDVDGCLDPYLDVEVWQVVEAHGGRELRLCERWGAGLGIGDGPVVLDEQDLRGVRHAPPPPGVPTRRRFQRWSAV